MSLDPPISRADGPRAVILLPTRELASQTADVFVQLTKSCIRIVSGCLIGGTKRKSQKASLRKGLNIIISTPQRLLDHLGKTSSLTLKGVRWLVIDEADRLVELGFERDVRRIIERVSREVSAIDGAARVQTVLLSATLTPGVENLAGLALRDPVRCEVSEQPSLHSATSKSDSPTQEPVTAPPAAFAMPTGLKHFLLVCPCKLRLVTLAAFLLLKARYNKRSGKIIVFFATQDCVDFHYRLFSETLCDTNDDVHSPLTTSDLKLFRLHGSMDHKDRFPVFQAYSNCPNGILLTTDVASRGLDLAGVAWVIQYHVSGTPVDYVHRVGRTARAGGRGKALLMLLPEEETYASTLRSTVGIELRKLEVADVLQTALFHVNNSAKMASRKKASVTTVEEAASSLSRYLLSTVSQDSELQALAEKAYLSFLRAYASFSGPMRAHFTFRRLHLGHVARAFCLQEAPSDIAAKVTGRRGASGHNEKTPAQRRRPHSTASSPPPVQKSRRLDFDADSTKQPTRALKHKPAELATRNMLAEYACLEIWTRALEEGFEVEVVYIDFRKAFDTVPHQRLLHKLSAIGIRGDLRNWIRTFLVGRKQRVCVGDDMSEWVNVASGAPQGSVLGPLLFILYVNDSLQELDCGKIMFADDVKLWQDIKGPNDQRSLQDNLHRLQAWSKKWLLDFNVEKCAVLHLRPTNSHSNESLRTYHLKDIRLPAETSQKDLGVWMRDNPKPTLQCHKAAKNAMGLLHAIKRAFVNFDQDRFVLCFICWFFGGERSLPWFLGFFFRFVAWSPGLFLPHNSFLLAMEKCELSNGEIARYSRQLIIPEFGPHGQQKLTDSRVLIVGCGGLGCPAAVYLAAAGVSRLTLVDDDVVEVSNLHRQVMHSEEKVGTPKVESLAERLRSINHHVIITTHNVHLTNQNACEIVAGHDVVLDCTDNVATRYLLNDACAACGPLPLVSGSALRLDGQLTVYLTAQPPSRITAAPDEPTKRNRQGEEDGLAKRRAPCYRCIHPIPPPSTSVQGCSDAGVIGVVPGIIGTMQAAETIKILTGIGESIAGRLFIMDMAKNTTRSVELRKPRPDCKTCAPSMLITPEIVKQTDYMEFCGAPNCDVPRQPNLAMGDTRITVEELKALRDNNSPHLLIDIRPSVEVEICRLKDCLYIPLPELYRDSNLTQICSHIRNAQPPDSTKPYPVILICRRGNKSHSTANLLASALEDMLSRANLQSNPDLFALDNGSVDSSVPIVVRDVAGGLQAWSEKIDPNFPQY
nr:unnamed protein product [Spirometra erinaceieuropaei]